MRRISPPTSHDPATRPAMPTINPGTPLVTYLVFSDKSKAVDFELYLKLDSEHTFANKQSW